MVNIIVEDLKDKFHEETRIQVVSNTTHVIEDIFIEKSIVLQLNSYAAVKLLLID